MTVMLMAFLFHLLVMVNVTVVNTILNCVVGTQVIVKVCFMNIFCLRFSTTSFASHGGFVQKTLIPNSSLSPAQPRRLWRRDLDGLIWRW